MTKRMIAAQLSVGALLLVLVALMESYTGWDTAAQRLWFDSATHEWVVSNELHARLTWFFYDGPKILLVVLGIACVAGVRTVESAAGMPQGVLAAAPQSGLCPDAARRCKTVHQCLLPQADRGVRGRIRPSGRAGMPEPRQ